MIKRMLRPRAVLPMGFALGLIVLFELGALPVPFDSDAGPIMRATIAVGLALVGAIVGFAIQWLLSRIMASSKRRSGTRDGA